MLSTAPQVTTGLGYQILRNPPIKGVYIPAEEATGNAYWTLDCCRLVIETLQPFVAAAGDGLKFKPAHLESTALVLNAHIVHGGRKSAKGVKQKVAELNGIYSVITYVKGLSGLTWSDVHSASITPADESVWKDITKHHPAATPFCNQGWDLYENFATLKPPKPKGSHVYRASSGARGPTQNSAAPPPSELAPSQTVNSCALTPPPLITLDAQPPQSPSPLPATPPPVVPSVPKRIRSPSVNNVTVTATPFSKRPRTNTTHDALSHLGDSIEKFGMNVEQSATCMAAARTSQPGLESSPLRRTHASRMVQEKEQWLTED
ncbi:hypothetical protein QCA50_012675 [Cerrena zonata]|uniref:Myb/SANT-like domain-containing protein n=1 Tax=Cerrena zonata TaxID=2478898 RepID=A0AAW0FU76_9APHY